jgi:hypothetical protein
MKYYAAVVNEDEIKAACFQPPYNILASYHYFKGKADLVKSCLEKHYDIFIDSGAFSAENSGKEINIDDYCQYIIDTGVKTYAGLDVIGKAKETRENNEYMIKEYGLNPIPTFHMGSNIRDLEKIAGGEYSYIALGGLVFSQGVMAHCDEVWHWILTHNPKLRVHGFGLTKIELMKRYPWYSVDSSSFKSCKRFGRQGVIWKDFEFETFSEEDYIEMLRGIGHVIPDPIKIEKGMDKEVRERITAENKKRWFLYDYYSVQSYKVYGAYLKELNKHRDFTHLKAQTKLFL